MSVIGVKADEGRTLLNFAFDQVFLDDFNNFSAFDEVWKEFFKTPPGLPLKPACFPSKTR
jgi:enamine deaminase RidA (YjgF/YER057c/UK114 family)